MCLVWCPWTPTCKVYWASDVYLIYNFCLLCKSDITCRKGQYIPWYQCLAKHLQYLQPVVTLCTFVLISDAIISKNLYFSEFACVIFTFPSFSPKMHALPVRCAVMSPCYVHYHWIKPCKYLYEKGSYVPNSS